MNIADLEKRFPMALASVAMDFDDFNNLNLYQKNQIKLMEVTPIVEDNKSWDTKDLTSTEKLLDQCRKFDVKPHSVHSFFLSELSHNMSDPDAERRKYAIKVNQNLFKSAKIIGAKYIVVHLYSDRTKRGEDENMSIALDSLKQLLPHAEKSGVGIAVENLGELWSVPHINSLLDEFNHPLIGICFDTGHSALYNELGKELPLCKDRLFALHIHDNFYQKDDHIIPFRGKIDWKEFTDALLKTNYQGPLMFESYEREEGESIDHFIKECRQAYLKLLALLSDSMSTK